MKFHPLEKDVNSFINSYPLRPPPLDPAKLAHFRKDPVAIFRAGQLNTPSYRIPAQVYIFDFLPIMADTHYDNYYNPYDADGRLDPCGNDWTALKRR